MAAWMMVDPGAKGEKGRQPALGKNGLPLHDELVEIIRDLIVTGDLPPGSRIRQIELSERLGVSRTPLREALSFLASEGLVVLLPNRGMRVIELTDDEIEQTHDVLRALEQMAAHRIVERISDEKIAEIAILHYQMVRHHLRRELLGYIKVNQQIHQKMVDATGNHVLAQTYAMLRGRIARIRFKGNTDEKRWAEAVQEHEGILKALQDRDGEKLAERLTRHIGAGWSRQKQDQGPSDEADAPL